MMRRCAMEFVGTFFLTLAISLIGHPASIGLILMAMIYVGGHVSGAHFNPAVSFACFIQNRLTMNDAAKYVLAQCLGSFLGLMIFGLLTQSSFALEIVPGTSVLAPAMIEVLFVLVFCWVYLTMNMSARYKDTAIPGIVLGLTLLAIIPAQGIFNPAVAVASYAYTMIGDINTALVYIGGPLLGALGASFMFDYFRPEI